VSIPAVVHQHLEEAAHLRFVRTRLVRGHQIGLEALLRADERLAAHLDGLLVSADEALAQLQTIQAAQPKPDPAVLFVAAVLALELRNGRLMEGLIDQAVADETALRAIASAMGWVSAPTLRGLSGALLSSSDSPRRRLGLMACRLHRVDPGKWLPLAAQADDAALRREALTLAGTLAQADGAQLCLDHLDDADPNCRRAAAIASVLQGDRERGLQALLKELMKSDAPRDALHDVAQVALSCCEVGMAKDATRQLAAQQADPRLLIWSAAWVGDARAVPWLIAQMTNPQLARLAGAAFSILTGADLQTLGLEGDAVIASTDGPPIEPEDDQLEVDPDDDLPWPNIEALQGWWAMKSPGVPTRTRLLSGSEPSVEGCKSLLRSGKQPGRCLAALHLQRLLPAVVAFNCAAPGRRQLRLL
jgi:uncharacterized protein (TIGR02270 family)